MPRGNAQGSPIQCLWCAVCIHAFRPEIGTEPLLICVYMMQETRDLFNAVVSLNDDEIQCLVRELSSLSSSCSTRKQFLADLNKHGKYGETPLMAAVLLKSTRTVTIMIDAGADVHACDGNGTTSLMLAAARGNCRTLRVLRDAGVPVELRDRDGHTALMYAVKHSRSAAVEILMEREGGRWGDGYGRSEVLEAASMMQSTLAKMMIRLGLYRDPPIVLQAISVQDYDLIGHMVCESIRRGDTANLVSICKVILKFSCGCGSCCPAETLIVEQALNVFHSCGSYEILDADARGEILLSVARRADPKTLAKVLDDLENVDINYESAASKGDTAIMLTLKHLYEVYDLGDFKKPLGGLRACISLLIDSGADVTVRDSNGHTPFHYAVYSTDRDTVKFMLDKCNGDIRSIHWTDFKAPGLPNMQHCRKIQMRKIDIRDVDIASVDAPWASGCCYRCISGRKKAMQRFLSKLEVTLPCDQMHAWSFDNDTDTDDDDGHRGPSLIGVLLDDESDDSYPDDMSYSSSDDGEMDSSQSRWWTSLG